MQTLPLDGWLSVTIKVLGRIRTKRVQEVKLGSFGNAVQGVQSRCLLFSRSFANERKEIRCRFIGLEEVLIKYTFQWIFII